MDVGGEYDPSRHRYDHHQKGFEHVMEIGTQKYSTKLSSAGLIYKHFGREVVAVIAGMKDKQADVDTIYRRMYEDFVEAFDGVDNGVSQYPADIKPAYRSSTDISSRVGRLMPYWNEENQDFDARFPLAVEMCGKEFTDRIKYYSKAWLPARQIVADAVMARKSHDESGKILVFGETFVNWKDHLFDLEKDLSISEQELPIYVLYMDSVNKQWRVQAVAQSQGSFASRKALPELWRGVRDDQLSKLSGIDGCVFVHATGFIGGTRSKEGALQMAQRALKM